MVVSATSIARSSASTTPDRIRSLSGKLLIVVAARVPRSLTREVTDQLHDAIQRASDDAAALLRLSQGDRVGSSAEPEPIA